MLGRIWQIVIKELIELRRDRWARFRLLVPPLIQVLIFGYAATFEIFHVSTTVLDLSHSEQSRALIADFVDSGRFKVVRIASTQRQAQASIDSSQSAIAIIIHAGFARALLKGQAAPVQILLDGTNSNSALIALGYANEIISTFSRRQGTDFLYRTQPAAVPAQVRIRLEERPWYNESLNSRWFFVPGVIATLTLVIVVNLTAFAIVREREVGTLEQILVSPIRPVKFILGKTVPFFLIGLGDIALVSFVGIAWFHVPFIGDPWVMLVGSALFLLALVGMGLLMSTFSRTQQQAFALNFFLLNPFFILSGFAFPIAAMPKVLQWFTMINPLRYFLVIIRAVFLKGVGFAVLWPELGALALLALIMLTISVLRFRKSLD